METRKHLKRKSAPLLILALFAGLGMFMSTLSAADDSFLLNPSFSDLKDGDVMLAPIGRRGAGVRMFVKSPDASSAAAYSVKNNGVWQLDDTQSAVHLSVVMPW